MAECKECGSKISKEHKFCPVCGAKNENYINKKKNYSVNKKKGSKNNKKPNILLRILLFPLMILSSIINNDKYNKGTKIVLVIIALIFLSAISDSIAIGINGAVGEFITDNKKELDSDSQISNENIDLEIAKGVDEKIENIGDLESILLEDKDLIDKINDEYNNLTKEQKELVRNYDSLQAAKNKIEDLESQELVEETDKQKESNDESSSNDIDEENNEKEDSLSAEEEYKEKCVDYSYIEVTKDETTYLHKYIKKDLMVRQLGEYTPTGEIVYICGEKKEGGSYVGGLFYVFDRRENKEPEIELYDKIYIYGKVSKLDKVSTWDRNEIMPYINAKYVEFNGKFGE